VTEPHPRFRGESAPDPDEPDDIQFVSFLKANAADVPEPAPEFEDRLMQVIREDSLSLTVRRNPRTRNRLNWRKVALIGVGLATVGFGLRQLQQWFAPPVFSTAELAQVESFMTGSWDETLQPSDAATDWNLLETKFNVAHPVGASGAGVDASLAVYSQP
jgi:hypothetical protein